MSQENVTALRRAYDFYNQTGEPDYSLLDPEIEYDVSRRVFDPAVYRGHEGVRQFVRLIQEQWESMRMEPQDFILAGEDLIVVPVRLVGTGRRGGVETTSNAAHVWTFRDGKVIRQTTFQTKDEALEAVGLRE